MNDTIWTKHEDAIQVKIPVPFPLKWVNSYLIKGSDGYTLIDPGIHTGDAKDCWRQVMDEIGIGMGDIEQIVLTHHHPDHYGLAGWFQQQAGCPVYISRSAWEQAQSFWGDHPGPTGRGLNDELREVFHAHGMDEDMVREMFSENANRRVFVTPHPEVTFLEAGGEIRLGDRMYEMIHTPGHATGHLCFYDRIHKVMFCGDHVLPKISPNVSYIPGIEEDPLQEYMESLRQIAKYDVNKAYPGHREPMEGTFGQRAMQLISHHEQRLAEMLAAMDRKMSAFALCRATFGSHLSIHQMRFAMGETLAHIIYLHRRGKLREWRDANGTILYSQ